MLRLKFVELTERIPTLQELLKSIHYRNSCEASNIMPLPNVCQAANWSARGGVPPNIRTFRSLYSCCTATTNNLEAQYQCSYL